jgi:cell wall-associated NlpC family hydrolase
MTGRRKKLARWVLAAVIALPLLAVSSTPSFASHPTQADVQAAKSKIDQLNAQLEAVVEQYNQAQVKLGQMQQHLAEAKAPRDRAIAAAAAARSELEARAVQAYTGMSSQVDTLLGAKSLSDFSDRLEFMGALAQSDADLATKADAARQQAEWATQQYNQAVSDAQAQVDAVSARRDDVNHLLDQAEAYYKKTSADYQAYQQALREQQAAAAAAAQQAQNLPASTGGGTSDPTGGGSCCTGPEPPVGQGASAAIAAAKAVLGAPYVFGTAGPSTFDCSGLTMWAWAHGGVSLPHSSADQYASLPHVLSLSQAQPGDLLFFYSPIAHVALYIGGGLMIHARHPGPGGEVQIGSVATYGTPVTGIARP